MHRYLLAALVLAAPIAPASEFTSYEEARRALVTAFQAGDHETALRHIDSALAFRPDYPPLVSARARIETALGRHEAALETLLQLAGLGVIEDVSGSEEFEAVRRLPAYCRLMHAQRSLEQPMGEYRVAARLDVPTFVPEGIAVDGRGRFYLGSIRHGRIVRLDGDRVETLVPDGAHGIASVFGLRVDDKEGLLWAATAVVPEGAEADPERIGRSGIFRFRLVDGAFVDAHWLPAGDKRRVLGDLILLGGDLAVTTDSLTGAVYELDAGTGEFTTLLEPGRLASPQGLVHDTSRDVYFIADWSGGLYRFHRTSGELTRLKTPEGVMPYGIDGLYLHDGDLVAVQNMVRPHRVTRFKVSEDGREITGARVVVRALPEFDEPTLGALRDDILYLNANSHWNRFDSDRRLQDGADLDGPAILAIPLAR